MKAAADLLIRRSAVFFFYADFLFNVHENSID